MILIYHKPYVWYAWGHAFSVDIYSILNHLFCSILSFTIFNSHDVLFTVLFTLLSSISWVALEMEFGQFVYLLVHDKHTSNYFIGVFEYDCKGHDFYLVGLFWSQSF